jgi:hypothetical protein
VIQHPAGSRGHPDPCPGASTFKGIRTSVSGTFTNGTALVLDHPPQRHRYVRRGNGSALADLVGYSVSYGTASSAYATTIEVPKAAADSNVIEGLTAGTWYLAIESRSVTHIESESSGEVVAVL